LGATATPEREDKVDILDTFGEVIYRYGLAQAMKDKRVVPVRQRAIFTQTSLLGVPASGKEFSRKPLGEAVRSPDRVARVVKGYLEHGEKRPALFFAAGVEHATLLRDALQESGIRAEVVHGEMSLEDRRAALADFRSGELQALTSCDVLTEGYDEKRASCVVMARPVLSKGLYAQCVGRGMRLDDDGGKQDCLVLDVVDQAAKRRVRVATSLFGAHVPDCQGQDIRVVVQHARAQWRLNPVIPTAAQEARWFTREDTPWERLPSLAGCCSAGSRDDQLATEKQLNRLAREGFDPCRDLTKGEASHLIKECESLDREFPTPPTPGQIYRLKQIGKYHKGLTKRLATRILGSGLK
jgi:superfamily II DNA or RNA helicase